MPFSVLHPRIKMKLKIQIFPDFSGFDNLQCNKNFNIPLKVPFQLIKTSKSPKTTKSYRLFATNSTVPGTPARCWSSAVHTGCPPLLLQKIFKFYIFDNRTPCKFLRELFMQKIRFDGLILTKLEGVKKKKKNKSNVRRAAGFKSFIV